MGRMGIGGYGEEVGWGDGDDDLNTMWMSRER